MNARWLQSFASLLACVFMSAAWSADATAPLARFTHADGAISVAPGGDFVDPYFAQKALTIVWESGLDASEATKQWLTWVIPRQRADGGFDRFCGKASEWRACKRADADDSSVASFLQLAAWYEKKHAAGLPGLPQAKKQARALLSQLKLANGTYRVFADTPTAYLMDNTEVYAGLLTIGEHSEAQRLKQAINKQFYTRQQWQPANVSFEKFAFYPFALAPTYRWHTGLVSQAVVEAEFGDWARQWGRVWLGKTRDEYAWGLVAWGARAVNDQHWLRCWRHMHNDHERSKGWTVIDEAVDRGLAHLGVEPVALSCMTVLDRK
jgi:hypothetical protein